MRYASSVLIICCISACLFAQGLTTTATKDDWEEINFEFNSAVLSDGYPSLLRLAELLDQHPDYKVRVGGHTDWVGPGPYNDKLALARAETVRSFLTKYGARAAQVEAVSLGKRDPKVNNNTIEGRFMNRRVVLTVTDGQGRIVSAGGVAQAIQSLDAAAAQNKQCCDEILGKLDKLDQILALLKDLKNENDQLRKDVAALQQGADALRQAQAGVQQQVAQLPKPPERQELAQMMEATAQKAIEETRPKRFQLLGVNLGLDTTGNLTVNARARYFSPFGSSYALQAGGEYLRYFDRQEGQFDLGLIDRYKNFQGGLFSSFKRVQLKDYQYGDSWGLPSGDMNYRHSSGGTLGQVSFNADYLFSRGRFGMYATKAFLDSPVISRRALTHNVVQEAYLSVVDQIGGSTQIGLYKDSYVEGNLGALFRQGGSNRPGGTARFVQPLNPHWAFTVEAGLNETLIGKDYSGRVAVGLEFGHWVRPKEFLGLKHPVPMDVPRIRYEVLARTVRTGNDPPVAIAGPDQIGVAAGTIQLDGSASYDPDGDPITFQWVQTSGPAVSITGANAAKASFTATPASTYVFRLTVTDDQGASSRAVVSVSTTTSNVLKILRFSAAPTNITAGETSTLSWETHNATSVTISGIGAVPPAGTTTVSPAQTTNYTLTASNGSGQITAVVAVQVTPGQVPRILRFAATPAEISPGEQSTLSWQVENADSVTISGMGSMSPAGTTTVSPTDTTTYTITATNQFGQVSAAATVTVFRLAKILNFVADPPRALKAGDAITLRWQTEDATEAVITGVGSVPVNGSMVVNPSSDISYTLIAYGKRSQSTALVIVRVGALFNRPPVANAGFDQVTGLQNVKLDGSKSYDPDGDPITYSWRLVSGGQATISGANTATPAVQLLGDFGDYTFELTVTDDKGATGSATTKVSFVDP